MANVYYEEMKKMLNASKNAMSEYTASVEHQTGHGLLEDPIDYNEVYGLGFTDEPSVVGGSFQQLVPKGKSFESNSAQVVSAGVGSSSSTARISHGDGKKRLKKRKTGERMIVAKPPAELLRFLSKKDVSDQKRHSQSSASRKEGSKLRKKSLAKKFPYLDKLK